jgi:hypothetical protein
VNVPEYNKIAETLPNGKPIYRAVVLSAHGMRSRGEWQKLINVPLTEAGYLHELLDFGNITARSVPLPQTATTAADIIRDGYYHLRDRAEATHAIAHSFGTIALAKSLKMNPELRLQHVILWGCVLRRDFPWSRLSKQVRCVLNEACERDPLPKLASIACVLNEGGRAGNKGFIDPEDHQQDDPVVFNRFHDWTIHSRLGTKLHCEENWIPFLKTGQPIA